MTEQTEAIKTEMQLALDGLKYTSERDCTNLIRDVKDFLRFVERELDDEKRISYKLHSNITSTMQRIQRDINRMRHDESVREAYEECHTLVQKAEKGEL